MVTKEEVAMIIQILNQAGDKMAGSILIGLLSWAIRIFLEITVTHMKYNSGGTQ
jgi:hypothetical protein